MKILVVLGHPRRGSFNHALAKVAVDTLASLGHEVLFHDLCAEGFDPLMPADELSGEGDLDQVISDHCSELSTAEGIVIVHPNWWGMPPAAMVGWIDRVFRPGLAYRFIGEDGGEGVPEGLLTAGRAVVLNTSDTEAERELKSFGDPLERIWSDCIFGLCGVDDVRRSVFRIVVTSTPDQRRKWLTEAAAIVTEAFPAVGL